MKIRVRKAVTISKATFYVNQKGELMATNDFKRFFPIDGLTVYASALDKTEIDTIKPYQIIVNGTSEYYPVVCEAAADANGDTGRADEGSASDERNSGDELKMRYETEKNYDDFGENEDVEEFIKGIDEIINGYGLWIALFIFNAILIAYALIKIF